MSTAVVYAIGSSEHGFVKIGTTSDLRARLPALQTPSPFPLRVLWQHEGGYALERFLHSHLREYRATGEWFDFGDADPVTKISEAMERYPSEAAPGSASAALRFAATRFTEARTERDGSAPGARGGHQAGCCRRRAPEGHLRGAVCC
ncbi:GIY-YIG nuclease family protein [Streptomyces sp. NPDC048665]|uniref:GIY-YIG nuclease family protein n=1 Tax=Streptomyces sp. NPDC048665 TaxID=3155490 RepID=UPI003439CC3D